MNLFPTQNITLEVKHELFFKTLPFLMFLIHRDKTEEKLLLDVDSALISQVCHYMHLSQGLHMTESIFSCFHVVRQN